MGPPARQCHNFIGGDTYVRSPAKSFDNQAASGAFASLTLNFANASMIFGQFEFNLGMWQKPEPVTDLLRNGDLTFTCDLHWYDSY
jgi:hypothetical protein